MTYIEYNIRFIYSEIKPSKLNNGSHERPTALIVVNIKVENVCRAYEVSLKMNRKK